jgi:hypothetical protein
MYFNSTTHTSTILPMLHSVSSSYSNNPLTLQMNFVKIWHLCVGKGHKLSQAMTWIISFTHMTIWVVKFSCRLWEHNNFNFFENQNSRKFYCSFAQCGSWHRLLLLHKKVYKTRVMRIMCTQPLGSTCWLFVSKLFLTSPMFFLLATRREIKIQKFKIEVSLEDFNHPKWEKK